MKKVTKFVTIATAMVLSLAVVPVALVIANNAKNNAAVAGVAEYYDIKVESNSEKVTVNVPLMAQAGSLVNYSIAANGEQIEKVLVNGELANFNPANNSGYFQMPEANVQLLVLAKVEEKEPEKDYYRIVNLNKNDGVVINGIDDYAAAGDMVNFQVGLVPGCPNTIVRDLKIYIAEFPYDDAAHDYNYEGTPKLGKEVEYVKFNNSYIFRMPDEDIALEFEVEGKGFVATFDNTTVISKVEVIGEDDTAIAAPGKAPSYFIGYNSKVRVTMKDTGKYQCKGIKIGNEEHLLEEGKMYLDFVMPAKDIEITALTDIIYYTVSFNNDDLTNHYNYNKIMRAEKTAGPWTEATDNKVCYNEYVRIYYTVKDGITPCRPNSVYAYYDNMTKSTTCSLSSDENGAYIQFYLTYGYDYTIQVKSEYKALKVTLPAQDNVTPVAVTKVGDNWVPYTGNFFYGDYLYVQFKIADGFEGSVKNVKLKYSTSSTMNMNVNDSANNVYRSANTLSNYDYTLAYDVVVAKFKGYNFVGEPYQTYNFWNYSGTKSDYAVFGSTKVQFTEFGDVTFSSSTYTFEADGANTVKSGTGTVLARGKKALYNDNWLVAGYGLSYDYTNTNDLSIGYRPTADMLGDPMYDFILCEDKGSNRFLAIQVYDDATYEIVDNMFMILYSANETFIDNVEFVFNDSWESVYDSEDFTVKVNGVAKYNCTRSTVTKLA
ncbi:MAG: hypothetical protein MJ217_00830 [Bacilli bacterium]|nr:hypothetical protein [Bacilli bacterium]